MPSAEIIDQCKLNNNWWNSFVCYFVLQMMVSDGFWSLCWLAGVLHDLVSGVCFWSAAWPVSNVAFGLLFLKYICYLLSLFLDYCTLERYVCWNHRWSYDAINYMFAVIVKNSLCSCLLEPYMWFWKYMWQHVPYRASATTDPSHDPSHFNASFNLSLQWIWLWKLWIGKDSFYRH